NTPSSDNYPTLTSILTSVPTSTFLFYNAPATTAIYTLSLHDALPIYHGERLHEAHDQRGDEASGERAQPAEHDHHEHDRPHREGHGGLSDQIVAADHSSQTGEGGTTDEDDGEHSRHVVAQRAHHLRVGQRRLDDEADAGAGQQEPDGEKHESRDQQHEAAIGVEF